MKQKHRPEKSYKFGSVRVSIWKGTRNTRDGRQFETSNVTIDRAYKDADGNWKNTSSLKENDIPRAIAALQAAFVYLTERPITEPDSDEVNVVEEEI